MFTVQFSINDHIRVLSCMHIAVVSCYKRTVTLGIFVQSSFVGWRCQSCRRKANVFLQNAKVLFLRVCIYAVGRQVFFCVPHAVLCCCFLQYRYTYAQLSCVNKITVVLSAPCICLCSSLPHQLLMSAVLFNGECSAGVVLSVLTVNTVSMVNAC